MTQGIISQRWFEYIKQGLLRHDAAQLPILRCFDRLHHILNHESPTKKRVPKGIYVYGSVGTGKSAAMEAFYESLGNKARRWHFHEFMLEVHDRMKKMSVTQVGESFAADTRVLCLDEMQITDLADGLILRQLLHGFWNKDAILVATSNREPDALYEDGPSRRYVLPLIHEIHRRCLVRCIDSNRDHRREIYRKEQTSQVSDEDWIHATVQHFFNTQSIIEWQYNVPVYINSNRMLSLPQVARYEDKKCCVTTVDKLCNNDLGAIDFAAIADQFDAFILLDLPTFNLKHHDQARRFIILIDVLYDKRKRLAFRTRRAGNDDPDSLFVVGASTLAADGIVQDSPSSKLVSIRELEFAFLRAASRLHEMLSPSWPPSAGFGVIRTRRDYTSTSASSTTSSFTTTVGKRTI